MKPIVPPGLLKLLATVLAAGLVIALYLHLWTFRSAVADAIVAAAALAVFTALYLRLVAHVVVTRGPLQFSLREFFALLTAAAALGSVNHVVDAILILGLIGVAYRCALVFRSPASRAFPSSMTKQSILISALALAFSAFLLTVASSVFVIVTHETTARCLPAIVGLSLYPSAVLAWMLIWGDTYTGTWQLVLYGLPLGLPVVVLVSALLGAILGSVVGLFVSRKA